MHVLFDARLLHRSLSGLERVQRNLLRALADRAEIRRLRVAVRPGTGLPAGLPPKVEPLEAHSTEDILRVLLDPGEPPDVYHLTWFPDQGPRDLWLPLAARASVVQVHDAILVRHPEYFPDEEAWSWYAAFCRRLVGNCDRLLCHSASVRREIERDLGGDPSIATVAPLAVEPDMARPHSGETVQAILDGLGVSGDYLVAIGKDYPHKDHATLFRALASLPESVGIVIAGSKVWHGGEDTERLLRRLRIEDRVRWIEGLDDAAVKALIQGARALVYPSLEEGFGLPPIEAMALDTPAVAAAAMSIPEVCQDAAWLFPPGDAGALAASLKEILAGGPTVDARVAKGREHARTFDWSRTAVATLDCYRAAREASNDGSSQRPRLAPELVETLRIQSTSKFDDARRAAEWEQRFRSSEAGLAELHGHCAELEARIRDQGESPPPAPPPPPVQPRRPRWSLRRRLRKIRDGLRRRPG